MNQKGAALLYAIAALVIFGSLGAGIAVISPSGSFTVVSNNPEQRAHYLALAGAKNWEKLQTTANPITYTLGDGKFNISFTGPGVGPFNVTSIGTVNPGTAFEANSKVTRLVTLESIKLNDLGKIKVVGDEYSIGVNTLENRSSYITKKEWSSLKDKYKTAWLSLAHNKNNTNGAGWYRETRGFCPGGTCLPGACLDGKCGLGEGIRVVYSFIFKDTDNSTDSRDYADVMAFAIMNAANNNPDTAAGGDDALGEYLGYAGLGVNGVGIKPPKIGIEFDTYPNDSRNDSGLNNHAAVLFWGERADSGYKDDNYHGAGTDSPTNPTYKGTAILADKNLGYHKGILGNNGSQANWLEDNTVHTVRIEIHRDTANRKYEIKVWVINTRPGDSDDFLDVNEDYPTTGTYKDYLVLDYLMPTPFTKDDDDKLDQVYFGFTEATGSATQSADIYGFEAEFIQ